MEGRRLTSAGLWEPIPSLSLRYQTGLTATPWNESLSLCKGWEITAKGGRSWFLRSPTRQSQNVDPGLQVLNADTLSEMQKGSLEGEISKIGHHPLAPRVPGRLGSMLWVTQDPAMLAQGTLFAKIYQWMKVTTSGTELMIAASDRLSAIWNLSSALSNYEKYVTFINRGPTQAAIQLFKDLCLELDNMGKTDSG